MEQMHSLLKRQLKHCFGDAFTCPKKWQKFIDMVNSTYFEFDRKRMGTESAFRLSPGELLQANAEMLALLQAFPDVFFLVDQEGTILDYKAGSTTDLYLATENFIGKRIQDVPMKNVKEKFNKAIRQVRETGGIGSIEYSLLIRGRELYYEARLLPLFEDRIFVIIRNITELKQAEKALRESERRLRAILDSIQSGILLIDAATRRITYVNNVVLELFGGDVIDSVCHRFICPIEEGQCPILDLGQEVNRCEQVLLTAQGGQVPVIKSVVPLKLKGRRYLLESFIDITERKRAEEKLRQTASELQAIFQALPDLYFRIDYEGTILDVKAGRTADLYLPPGNLVGRKIQDVSLSPSIRYQFLQAIEQVRQTKSLVLIEYFMTFKDEKQFFEARFLPLLEDQIVAVIRNITERKTTEERLRYLSLHDPLTGLYNRAYFEQEMRRLGEGRCHPIGMIMCDVDGLKFINDTLGHDTGDALLLAAAEVLKDSFRKEDVVARVGGDEFAVLLPNSDRDVVEAAAQRLRNAIAGYNAVNPKIPLSMSVGCSVSSGPVTDMNELYREADNNMYKEKLYRRQSKRSSIVQTLMKALEARDLVTESHSERLQGMVVALARALGIPLTRENDLRLLAQFHDIGKVGVPDRILFKPGPLTSQEAAEMRRHCEIGYRIAQASNELAHIADWILKHHEWWNGEGYPLGLKGEEIPIECRILSICDAYESMISDRPYRKAMTHQEAVAELGRCAGTQFDPQIVAKFLELLEKGAPADLA